MLLSDLPRETPATVCRLLGAPAAPEVVRLRTLGFVVGATVEVERQLPLQGPIVVRFGGAVFALERAAAALIEVTLAETGS